jgi:hypothetical protein
MASLGQFFNTDSPVYGQTKPAGVHRKISKTFQGTFATNAVSYGLSEVNTSTTISSSFFNSLITNAKSERVRRGKADANISAVSSGTAISATTLNDIRNAYNVTDDRVNQAWDDWSGANANSPTETALPTKTVWGPTAAPSNVPGSVSSGTKITASVINSLVNSLNAAGAVCTCNCNYCTCNCNYCTCNCNYSCTCNCNY